MKRRRTSAARRHAVLWRGGNPPSKRARSLKAAVQQGEAALEAAVQQGEAALEAAVHQGEAALEAAVQQGEAAMQQGEAAMEHDQRDTMNPAPLITARLRVQSVDAIPIQLAIK